MLPTPTKFMMVAGSGEGNTELNAFDAALLNAGAGNLNLVKISSILPPHAELQAKIHIPPSSLVPTAYSKICNNEPGELIAAAVAVGIPEDSSSFGVIMECSGKCTKEELSERITTMVIDAFKMRNLVLKEVKVAVTDYLAIEHGSCFAGVLLWY